MFDFFIDLINLGYQQLVSQQFISLQTDMYCEQVPASFSGIYYVDTNGYYQSEVYFQYPLALYSFEFSNLQVTNVQYTALVAFFHSFINHISITTLRNDIGDNILLAMVLQPSYSIGKDSVIDVQIFKTVIAPAAVYDRGNYYASIGNSAANCAGYTPVAYSLGNLRIVRFSFACFVMLLGCWGSSGEFQLRSVWSLIRSLFTR